MRRPILMAFTAWAASAAAIAQTLPAPPASPAPVAKYEYDAEGNPTKTTLAPATKALATQQGYDALGRRTSITDAKNGLLKLGYDYLDQLTSITDPRNLVTQYQSTGLGDVKQLVSPDTGTTNSTFDTAGNLKTRTDARGVLATYGYDALNRVKQVVYSRSGNASRTITLTYDQTGGNFGSGVGHITTAATPDATTTVQYNSNGQVTKTVQTGAIGVPLTVTYGIENGNVTKLTYPSGRSVYIGRVNGRPVSTGMSAGGVVTALLDQAVMSPFGPVQSWIWRLGGVGRLHQRVYDANGRLVRQPLGNLVRDITYDDADRISRFTHYTAASAQAAPAYDQSFGYDELGRLVSVTGSINYAYSYDANGNRTASTTGSTTRAYTVSATSNRLDGLTNPSRTLLYWEDGSTKSDNESGSSASYTASYSLEGRLASMLQANAAGVDFGYDGLGRRVTRSQWTGSPSNPRTVTLYAYDTDNHLLGEYQADGTPITEYIWFGDTPVAVVKTDSTGSGGVQLYAIHTDHLDTPRMVLDASGQVRWRWMGDPFGGNLAEQQPTAGLAALQQNLRFPGQQFEAFGGRHYNHFRDYDPSTGRYVQGDPIGQAGGINSYAYVANSPLDGVDPAGLNRNRLIRPDSTITFEQAIAIPQANRLIELIREVRPGFRYETISEQGANVYDRNNVRDLMEIYRDVLTNQNSGRCSASWDNFVKFRAEQLRSLIPDNRYITLGAAYAETATGEPIILIGTNEPRGYLRPGFDLNPWETMVPGRGHAEADIANFSNLNGLRLGPVGATRPICAGCAGAIDGAGGYPVTPLKGP
ncbi:hypothetical protein LXT12_14940 [Pelomonas sp. P7]|uniref:Teneurin-like YD-shell domain-containing protein n=1 Tax=Pelomonas caseinilytica TaxID=2906763 RepID=A0ABS8XI94_9BURK|nr:RHS repeat-associated core domain-containing protein [Pelomonas sp. P7]MCE4538546.1 hypothetical protein [Pelomonas sp. P7]